MNARRLLFVPAVFALALLASGGFARARRNIYPANPCTTDDARFQSLHGGCYDSQTNLVWSMNAGSPQRTASIWDYPGAQNYAANLNEGGETGWRLPTLAEMQAIAGPLALNHLNIFTNGAGNFQDSLRWSSTAGKKLPGGCTSSDVMAMGGGAAQAWSNSTWGTKCGSATDFVCVRVHQPSDPN